MNERYECHLGPACMEWDVTPHRHRNGIKEYPPGYEYPGTTEEFKAEQAHERDQ